MLWDGGGRFQVRCRRIQTPGGVVDGAVVVSNGKIERVVAANAVDAHLKTYDAGDLCLLPGAVDTHVHVNEPGRTDWEGYETATRAAAAGGITTLVDMPLNCIPVTTSVKAFETKLAALQGKLTIDCGFYGGVVPGNVAELAPMVKRGVLGFKAFLVHSGIDDFPDVKPGDLDVAMPEVARAGVPLLVHAELEGKAEAPLKDVRPEPYSSYLLSRPRAWENDAVQLMIDKCRATRCRVHVVHLSSSDAVPLLHNARKGGVPITAETCPHYLTFTAEEIQDGDTRFKCAPPIREKANRERLWKGLEDGDIHFVVSDHSPCAPHLKLMERGDFEGAWGGIAGLQFGLSAVWQGASERGLDLAHLVRWLAERPAALVGLSDRKGKLEAGADADLVVFDPGQSVTVKAADVQHKHKVTPYEGRVMKGKVEATFVRGKLVYERGQFTGEPSGRPVLKGE
jgi:allantoinase